MYSRANFEKEADVSRETVELFAAWQALLIKWNAKINLVARSTLDDFWWRHALDSWQVWRAVPPSAKTVLDMGSGAGFPGLAMAIGLKTSGRDGQVTLVESAGKKTTFLNTAIRELGLPARASRERVEELPHQNYDVLSARAFAPLPMLLTYAQPFWGPSTIGLFLKGESWAAELTEVEKYWRYTVKPYPSVTDTQGRLLVMSDLVSKDRTSSESGIAE